MKNSNTKPQKFDSHLGLWLSAVVLVALLFYFSGMLNDLQSNFLGMVNQDGTPYVPPSVTPRPPVFDGGGTAEGLYQVQDQLQGSGVSTSDSIIAVVIGWIDFALPFAGLFAFVALVYAGFLYVTAFTDEGQAEKAKNIVFWVAIGIVLIFSAYAITSTLIGASS